MQVTFLIGGTGNQFFQFASAPAEGKMSTLFLNPSVRQLLGWTQHEQFIEYDGAGPFRSTFSLGLLAIDLILAKLFKLSLFTQLDTRGVSLTPKVKPLVRLGYFQSAPLGRSLGPLARQFAPVVEEGTIALHVRGGDLLALERAGRNDYGLLDDAYYRKGITQVRDILREQGRSPTKLLVLTDDPEYAATRDLNVEGVPEREIQHIPLKETLARAVGAEWYISSNSTMSYWIVQLREGQRSFAPEPFQKRRDYDLHDAAKRIASNYK